MGSGGATGGNMNSGGTTGSGGTSDTCTETCLDGETCSDGQCECPGGRVTYYRDMDGDGHGDLYTPLEVCGDAPEGYVELDDDCCDQDYLANPEQDTPQPIPTQCGSNDFDYNCDGEVLGWPYFSSGTCGVAWVDGWYGYIPNCGDYGTYIACNTMTKYPESFVIPHQCL